MLLVPILSLVTINQIINYLQISDYFLIIFRILQFLSQLSLFLIFFPSFSYNLSHHYLNLNLSYYLNQTLLIFQSLIFFYFKVLQKYLKFLYKDHKVHQRQIILSFHIQVQQYLHFQTLQTFYQKLDQQVNYQKKQEYFQYFMKLFH